MRWSNLRDTYSEFPILKRHSFHGGVGRRKIVPRWAPRARNAESQVSGASPSKWRPLGARIVWQVGRWVLLMPHLPVMDLA